MAVMKAPHHSRHILEVTLREVFRNDAVIAQADSQDTTEEERIERQEVPTLVGEEVANMAEEVRMQVAQEDKWRSRTNVPADLADMAGKSSMTEVVVARVAGSWME